MIKEDRMKGGMMGLYWKRRKAEGVKWGGSGDIL